MWLSWSKMTAFLGFVSKDFGELGSLFERSEFEQVPKVYTKSQGMLILRPQHAYGNLTN
jgi:hypothetical protein